MKLVIQRVRKASVFLSEEKIEAGNIGQTGLFVLFGAVRGDTKEKVDLLAEKLAKLRIMADEDDKMNLSVKDAKAPILLVSQFTLYADTSKGNRPSFVKAEEPDKAKELYEYFVESLRKKDIKVETGKFGEYMEISAVLDGPVTIILEE